MQGQIKTLPKTEYSFFDKLKNSLKDEQSYEEIMKCFLCYVEGVFSMHEFFDLVIQFFDKGNEDLFVSLKQMVVIRDNARRHHNLLCKPYSEFDIAAFKKISYSYYELPAHFPKTICSGKGKPEFKEICAQNLNDQYTSLPQGSESFKFKFKNQYEDLLFRTEDDMYKVDHEICNIRKTMLMMEAEKAKLEEMSPEERGTYQLCKKKFNILRLKQIERMYAELGQEMLKLLPHNPAKAIPIIYDRLKITYQRTLEDKHDQMKAWQDSIDKNFYKSLDHRSFHFKIYEKKNQQAKSYLAEIKTL